MMDLLLKPIDYLYIKWAIDDISGKNKKPTYDWYLPVCFSGALCFFLCLTYEPEFSGFKIFFESKGFDALSNFLLSLPGFLFAGLTAVVSFNNPQLDITARHNPPISREGHEISRRRFLSNAFSYLTFLSLILFFSTVLINYCYSACLFPVSDFVYMIGYIVLAFLFFIFVFQMFFILCMTLYYIGDKLHQP